MGDVKVETKLILSKLFPATTSAFTIGRYQVRPIRSVTVGHSEAVLEFENSFRTPDGGRKITMSCSGRNQMLSDTTDASGSNRLSDLLTFTSTCRCH